MTNDQFKLIVLVITTLLIVLAMPIWLVFQWNMCRDAGLSFWYCIQHIL